MIRLIEEVKTLIENENLQEKYPSVYGILVKMTKSRELDKESNKLNNEINEYLKGENKENK